jgi:hypothetical protein
MQHSFFQLPVNERISAIATPDSGDEKRQGFLQR